MIISRLGDVLLNRLAVLFPDVYRLKHFIKLEANTVGTTLTEPQNADIAPKKYFFAYISSFFGKHMVCQCKQRAHGVLLYRRGSDLSEVLLKTLKSLPNSSTRLLGSDNPYEDDEKHLLTFCENINDRIHKQIRSTTSADAQTPYDISNFKLQSCIDSIDPLLWKMIVLITRSVREKLRHIEIENISHQRKLQCLYTLCVILFNTNRTCSVPLHLLLTDLVEAQGGSSELVRLLNSVGAIASADTHQRNVQFYIEKKRILSEINMDQFTL